MENAKVASSYRKILNAVMPFGACGGWMLPNRASGVEALGLRVLIGGGVARGFRLDKFPLDFGIFVNYESY